MCLVSCEWEINLCKNVPQLFCKNMNHRLVLWIHKPDPIYEEWISNILRHDDEVFCLVNQVFLNITADFTVRSLFTATINWYYTLNNNLKFKSIILKNEKSRNYICKPHFSLAHIYKWRKRILPPFMLPWLQTDTYLTRDRGAGREVSERAGQLCPPGEFGMCPPRASRRPWVKVNKGATWAASSSPLYHPLFRLASHRPVTEIGLFTGGHALS